MIHYLAQLYVNFLEPAFKVLAVIVVVAFVLYLFNLLRGKDMKGDFVSTIVNFIVKAIMKTIQLTGKLLLKSLKVLLETISLIIATVRDFLTSKI